MTIDLGTIGVWVRSPDAIEALAMATEDLGYGALWVGSSPPGDLGIVTRLLHATTSLPVATGIVNMWKDDAATVADSYRRIETNHPGRFVLGVGIGHPEATSDYASPYDTIVRYLADLATAGVPPDRTVLAALGPKVLTVAAERTAGAHPYLTSPRHTAFARSVMGAGPLLAPEQKVIVDVPPGQARASGRAYLARYLRLDNYRRNLMREGWPEEELSEGGSDRLVDTLVLHGDVATIAAGVRAHLAAGADHVSIQPLGDDPIASLRTLAGTLLG